MRLNANQAGSTLVDRNPTVVSTGTTAASHSVGRRPRRWVMAEANGVMQKMPSQAVAANRPITAVDTPSPLSRNTRNGVSMK